MIINTKNLKSLQAGYQAAFNGAFEGTPTDFQKVAMVVPSTTSKEIYGWLGQFPKFREWIGEREIQNMSASDYTLVNRHFENTISVNRDEIEDDVYGIYTPLFQDMGRSGAELPDDLVFEALAGGFTGKCFDGKAFFATDHKVGKNTVSNMGTAKLSVDAYAAARAGMMAIKGDKGKPLGVLPNLLVVPPALEGEARKILMADQIDGTTNIWKGTAELLVSTKLAAAPTAWFLLDTRRAVKPLIYQDRKKVQFISKVRPEDPNVFDRNEYVYGADGRGTAGYGFWQMAFGSDGSAS